MFLVLFGSWTSTVKIAPQGLRVCFTSNYNLGQYSDRDLSGPPFPPTFNVDVHKNVTEQILKQNLAPVCVPTLILGGKGGDKGVPEHL